MQLQHGGMLQITALINNGGFVVGGLKDQNNPSKFESQDCTDMY